MNMTHFSTQAPPAPALADKDVLLGRIDELQCSMQSITHRLHFLMDSLEDAFRHSRGTELEPGIYTLNHSVKNMDAILWLTSDTWSKATDVCEAADRLVADLEAAK